MSGFDERAFRANYNAAMAERGASRLVAGIQSGEIRLSEDEIDTLELLIDGLTPEQIAATFIEKDPEAAGYQKADLIARAERLRDLYLDR